MCNHSAVGEALNKINNSDKTHPLNNVIDQPLIDPILQGDMTISGDVVPGSYVDKKNQNLGLSDASQAATFFAKSIAAAFGLAAAFGVTPSGGIPNAAGTATGEAVGTGTATGAADSAALTGQSGAQTVQGGGGTPQPNTATGTDTLGNISTGEGTGAADASGTNAQPNPDSPTTTPKDGSTLGNALKLAAQAAPVVTALLSADNAANQASNAQNAANNLTPSTPPPEPQAAVDPDLSLIRKRNALIFGLDSPASTDLTLGKADTGSLGRVTLLGGSTNRLGA